MTYCVITGETAVGQPANLENGMEGIQKLIDRYIDMQTYLYY